MHKNVGEVVDYIPLVEKVAFHIHQKTKYIHNLDDLQQSGFIGLLDSFSKYKELESSKFETYAVCRIKGSILDSLRASDYLNQDDRKKVNKMKEIKRKLISKLGKAESKDIAFAMNLSIDDYFQLLSKENSSFVSLENNKDVLNITDNVDPEESLEREQEIKNLGTLVSQLGEKEQMVLQLMYVDELIAKDIAKVLDISGARVSQIHKEAIEKLKKKMI